MQLCLSSQIKADDVRNMENNNTEMEYITLPTTGIYTDMHDQNAHYAGFNEYQWQGNNYGQNHVDNSNGHFGNCEYSTSPNGGSCCCGYDSKGQNSQAISKNTQNYGQVEYQYEYDDQYNTNQSYDMNRCAGGMESSAPPLAYQSQSNENNNCPMKQEEQSDYFTIPSLGNVGMNLNHLSPEYWSSSQNTEDFAYNSLQNQTVYSSEFQPNHEAGNNFNHFPNNHFMDMFEEMIQPSNCQSISPGYSQQFGDPTYDMGENRDFGGIQMQRYSISNVNYMQMCSS